MSFNFSPSQGDLKALIAQAHRSIYRRESIPVITDLIDNIMSIPSCLQVTNRLIWFKSLDFELDITTVYIRMPIPKWHLWESGSSRTQSQQRLSCLNNLDSQQQMRERNWNGVTRLKTASSHMVQKQQKQRPTTRMKIQDTPWLNQLYQSRMLI